MSTFRYEPQYLTPLEPGYGTAQERGGQGRGGQLEAPIITIGELGTTVIENDPRTGAHILQNVQAAIRAGAKELQLIMNTPSTSAIGGRPKAYGKEVRQAIKEVAMASNVNIRGMEMPTSSMSNLSGYDPQRGTISEQKRQDDMQEVRDAMDFMAEVADGGGVDIWSQEFPRTMFDAEWNEDVKKSDGTLLKDANGKPIPMFREHDRENELAVKVLVDKRTGRLVQEIRMNQEIAYPNWNKAKEGETYTDKDGNDRIAGKGGVYTNIEGIEVDVWDRVPKWDPVKETFEVEVQEYKYFAEIERKELTKIRKHEMEKKGLHFDEKEHAYTPEEAFFVATTKSQEATALGWAKSYQRDVEELRSDLERLKKALAVHERIEAQATTEAEKAFLMREVQSRIRGDLVPPETKMPTELLKDMIKERRRAIASATEMAKGQLQSAKDANLQAENIISADRYAKKQTIKSYSELGMHAYRETNNRGLSKPLYVGPELGWPQAWGGHPEEFVDLIKTSRKEMIRRLQKEEGLHESEAKKVAKQHIKGLFDTGHMGMWLNKYRRLPGESEEKRLGEFKKWFGKMTDLLIKEDVVGSIQAVDSASGAHGHLPPGQGIFPVVESVEKFKKSGWNGWIVSEGHEEEKFGANRILLKTWEAFGTSIYGAGAAGGPRQWNDVSQSYFGNTYPPYFITQSYVPVNDFKLWSEVQLE